MKKLTKKYVNKIELMLPNIISSINKKLDIKESDIKMVGEFLKLMQEYNQQINEEEIYESYRLHFGKYKGWSIEDIFNQDIGYLLWLINNFKNDMVQAKIKKYLDEIGYDIVNNVKVTIHEPIEGPKQEVIDLINTKVIVYTQEDLDNAIAIENYELASIIRDYLKYEHQNRINKLFEGARFRKEINLGEDEK